eukprot:1963286-Rhodomonas_salina.1
MGTAIPSSQYRDGSSQYHNVPQWVPPQPPDSTTVYLRTLLSVPRWVQFYPHRSTTMGIYESQWDPDQPTLGSQRLSIPSYASVINLIGVDILTPTSAPRKKSKQEKEEKHPHTTKRQIHGEINGFSGPGCTARV